MTTMISKGPRTATGGPSSTPIVTVSMYGSANDEQLPEALIVDHVEILPTTDEHDADNVYADAVARMVRAFGAQGIKPEYAPIKPDASGYRKVTFRTEQNTLVTVEKF